jgi:MFS transporter, DHA2 family, glioxin efflux transporter
MLPGDGVSTSTVSSLNHSPSTSNRRPLPRLTGWPPNPVPIGAVAALGVLIYFDSSLNPPQPENLTLYAKVKHLDPVGIVLAMAGITCFILALQYGGVNHAWNSSVVIGLFVGTFLLFAVLVGWQLYLGDFAMMPPRLWKTRVLPTTSAFGFFYFGSFIVLLYYLPIYFQSILGASPIQSGVNNLPLVLTAALFSLVGGVVVASTGRAQLVIMICSMLTTISIGLIYWAFDIGTSSAQWIGYQVFVAAVMSFAIMHGLTIAQANAPLEDLPAVTANVLCEL